MEESTQLIISVSEEFFKTAQGRIFDFECEQLSEKAFVSKWIPILNEFGSTRIKDPETLKFWVQCVLAEVEIHLPDHQH